MNLMPSCKDVRENLTEYMEGKLPLSRRMGIRIHLMMCKVCDGLLHTLQTLPTFAKEVLRAPAEAPAEAKETYDRFLKNIRETSKS
ncbi:MAG: zf-HC2 domain-containing protein [Holophagaceae bacterium]|nr:zf-HC2 domain-containing protein [Holophagaceae bacterium]